MGAGTVRRENIPELPQQSFATRSTSDKSPTAPSIATARSRETGKEVVIQDYPRMAVPINRLDQNLHWMTI
jgi:hypothetical protein